MEHVDYLRLAYHEAKKSRDTSVQNGALIVNPLNDKILTRGCNDLPNGVTDTPERRERPLKYAFTEHAERAAILAAARNGIRTDGMWMYCAWAACPDCARAIAMSGIKRLIRHDVPAHREHKAWLELCAIGDQILREAGVELLSITEEIGETVLFQGVRINV